MSVSWLLLPSLYYISHMDLSPKNHINNFIINCNHFAYIIVSPWMSNVPSSITLSKNEFLMLFPQTCFHMFVSLSVQPSRSVVSDSLQPHGLQHARPPCHPGAYSSLCPLSQWCHPTVSSAFIICSDFGAQENKVCHCFHCFPMFLPWRDGTGCHDFFKCWVLNQLFHAPLVLSSRGSLIPLCFLP